MADIDKTQASYGDDSIQTLEWNEHIRKRSGMYIGTLGNGTTPDDGIYMLLKEVIDNSIDEFSAGFGREIIINVDEKSASVRDYGQGIPLGSVVKATSTLNTGGRFDDSVYKKSIGMNGVGTKAVNALSTEFHVYSVRNGEKSWARFSRGQLLGDGREPTDEKNGTFVSFIPDDTLFIDYSFRMEFVEEMVKKYSYVKPGLTLVLNGVPYRSEKGLVDDVTVNLTERPLYPPIHLKGEDIEVVLTHSSSADIKLSSFTNGQYTRYGGTHQNAYREAIAKVLMDFFKKGDYTADDCRQGVCGAISVQLQDPVFDSQKKSKMTSDYMWVKDNEKGPTVRSFVVDFLSKTLEDYLYVHKDVAGVIEGCLKSAKQEREEISRIRSENKKPRNYGVYNENLRDCKYHYCDKETKNNAEYLAETSIFITEGKSASGTVTKSRDANFQAVFSIRGKSKNSYQSSESKILENEELRNLVAALGIGNSLSDLRFNKVVISTDADDDGMHIRLLLSTFFLKYYPELVKENHLFVLETPLFRVKTKKENRYFYTGEEKDEYVRQLNSQNVKSEITRFKGLGEINESEFKHFIGKDIRLSPIVIAEGEDVHQLLAFYMGKNTYERQQFIIRNLRTEEELEGVNI